MYRLRTFYCILTVVVVVVVVGVVVLGSSWDLVALLIALGTKSHEPPSSDSSTGRVLSVPEALNPKPRNL